MGEGEEHGIIKIADFGLARIYQAPLKALCDNGVSTFIYRRTCPLASTPAAFLCSSFQEYK